MRRSGFTLVELAIVLVIIGLLIAGILVARSMIDTSKISSQAKQLQQFDAGVATFKDKYRYLPGDAPAFGGDGNGAIALDQSILGGATAGPVNNTFACEIANFWNHIDSQQFPGSTVCTEGGVQAVKSGTTKNVPLSKMGQEGSFIIAAGLCGSDTNRASLTNIQNYYVIMGPTQSQTSYQFTSVNGTNNYLSSTKPSELLALDKKIDDGLANAGYVFSGFLGLGINAGIPLGPGAFCANGANYYVNSTHSGYECTPLIRIGGQTGDPQ